MLKLINDIMRYMFTAILLLVVLLVSTAYYSIVLRGDPLFPEPVLAIYRLPENNMYVKCKSFPTNDNVEFSFAYNVDGLLSNESITKTITVRKKDLCASPAFSYEPYGPIKEIDKRDKGNLRDEEIYAFIYEADYQLLSFVKNDNTIGLLSRIK